MKTNKKTEAAKQLADEWRAMFSQQLTPEKRCEAIQRMANRYFAAIGEKPPKRELDWNLAFHRALREGGIS